MAYAFQPLHRNGTQFILPPGGHGCMAVFAFVEGRKEQPAPINGVEDRKKVLLLRPCTWGLHFFN
jgi:hypothetical protein